MSPRAIAVAVTTVIVVFLLTTNGRTQPISEPPDTLSLLLSEVRALRTTIEVVASAGTGGHLALGRLQLQEQRVNAVIQRLESTRERLVSLQRTVADQRADVTRLEASLKDVDAGRSSQDRDETESLLKAYRADLANNEAEIQQLADEEAGLASQLAVEQSRWSDLNRTLEEIEAALTRRQVSSLR